MLHVFCVLLFFRDPLVKEVFLESEVILVLLVGLEEMDRKAKEYESTHAVRICFDQFSVLELLGALCL